jgi:hypothetical protein
MTTIKWSALGSDTSYLTTELNSLANAARVLGAEIDNTSGKDLFSLVELNLATQGSARSAGGYVGLYVIKASDGTNYEYGDASTAPPSTSWVGGFPLDAATTARLVSIQIQLPPCKFKLLVVNATGQAFAASGTTVSYRTYNYESV